MCDLSKIKLGHSPLTDSIYLYREGAIPGVALDKRPAESDVLQVLTEYMMHGSPTGSVKTYSFGDQHYRLTLAPITAEEAALEVAHADR